MEHYHIILEKSHQQGYGFTIANGPHASVISNIKAETPAENSGLKVGDWIICINGQSVEKTHADSIGQIIKHYPRCIVLDVFRPVVWELLTLSLLILTLSLCSEIKTI